ncbi:MAG: SanA/YdcF family protein [Roseimicrobium sp.]
MPPRRKLHPTPTSGPPLPAPAPLVTPEEEPRVTLGERIHRELVWFDGFLKQWLLRLMVFGTHLTVVLSAIYLLIWLMARNQCYDSVADVPHRVCGVVLGTVPKVGGKENLFFTTRIRAAVELYDAGKVQYLIVSGDNSRAGYDEPSEMKAALIANGVPSRKIYCDYGGLRTLDSVVRAQKVFGQDEFTIVSHAFHNQRAIYIAKRLGLPHCVAFNAKDASADKMISLYARELGARILAVLDVEFLKTQPKYLGDEVRIGENHPPLDSNPLPKR